MQNEDWLGSKISVKIGKALKASNIVFFPYAGFPVLRFKITLTKIKFH
jgi:hypothetical protein